MQGRPAGPAQGVRAGERPLAEVLAGSPALPCPPLRPWAQGNACGKRSVIPPRRRDTAASRRGFNEWGCLVLERSSPPYQRMNKIPVSLQGSVPFLSLSSLKKCVGIKSLSNLKDSVGHGLELSLSFNIPEILLVQYCFIDCAAIWIQVSMMRTRSFKVKPFKSHKRC